MKNRESSDANDHWWLKEKIVNRFCYNLFQAAQSPHNFFFLQTLVSLTLLYGSGPACQSESALSPLSPIQLQENARLSFQAECMGCALCNHQCQQSTVPEAAPVKMLTGWRDGKRNQPAAQPAVQPVSQSANIKCT